MKKTLIMLLSTALLLVACNNTSNKEQNNEPAEETTKSEVETNKKEIETDDSNNQIDKEKIQYADFQSAIPTEWQIHLPTSYPVAEGKFLTAKTATTENEITFEFYQFDEEVELDAPNVADGDYIGHLIVMRYEDEFTADQAMASEFVIHDDYVADVGSSGILVYPYQEGDTNVVNWNDNMGWYGLVRSQTKSESDLLAWLKEENLVTKLVEGVKDSTYPKPQIVGKMDFDVDDITNTFITWAEKEIVFTLKDFGDNTLDWLHVFSR